MNKQVLILQLNTLLQQLNNLLVQLQAKLKQKMTLLDLAKSKLGTDFTDDRNCPDEVSCVYAVSTILNELNKEIPIRFHTGTFYQYMKSRTDLFEEIPQPIDKMEGGWIVISPTGYGKRPDIIQFGHIGIYFDDDIIMSNDSYSGLWEKNYTRETWRERWGNKGGYPIYIFKLK